MGVDPDLVASQVYISDMIELKRALRRLYKSQQGANGTTKQGTIALDMWIELKEAIVKANPEV